MAFLKNRPFRCLPQVLGPHLMEQASRGQSPVTSEVYETELCNVFGRDLDQVT